jgi:phosphatidylinositol N-acetylglucosaminyltransferase subunit P
MVVTSFKAFAFSFAVHSEVNHLANRTFPCLDTNKRNLIDIRRLFPLEERTAACHFLQSAAPTSTEFNMKEPQKGSGREYYGFVLYISSIICAMIYVVWGIFGNQLEILGITFADRRWAVVLPIWIIGLIPFAILFFIGYTFLKTRDLDSFELITDRHAKIFTGDAHSIEKILDQEMIPALQDVPLSMVNRCWKHEL